MAHSTAIEHLAFRVYFPKAATSRRREYIRGCFKALERKELSASLPCGLKFRFDPESFPLKDSPCPCGAPNHTLVLWTEGPNL